MKNKIHVRYATLKFIFHSLSKKWQRVVITQRKVGENSTAPLSAALFWAKTFALRKSQHRMFRKFCAKLRDCYSKMEKHITAYKKYELCVTIFALTSNGPNSCACDGERNYNKKIEW